ncbi:unnamed protein product [Musa textilis]
MGGKVDRTLENPSPAAFPQEFSSSPLDILLRGTKIKHFPESEDKEFLGGEDKALTWNCRLGDKGMVGMVDRTLETPSPAAFPQEFSSSPLDILLCGTTPLRAARSPAALSIGSSVYHRQAELLRRFSTHYHHCGASKDPSPRRRRRWRSRSSTGGCGSGTGGSGWQRSGCRRTGLGSGWGHTTRPSRRRTRTTGQPTSSAGSTRASTSRPCGTPPTAPSGCGRCSRPWTPRSRPSTSASGGVVGPCGRRRVAGRRSRRKRRTGGRRRRRRRAVRHGRRPRLVRRCHQRARQAKWTASVRSRCCHPTIQN